MDDWTAGRPAGGRSAPSEKWKIGKVAVAQALTALLKFRIPSIRTAFSVPAAQKSGQFETINYRWLTKKG